MRVHSIPHGWLVRCDNALPGAPNDGFSAVLGAVLLGFHLERDGPAEPVQGHGVTVEAGWGQQVSGSVSMWMHIAEGSGFSF